jgi:diadenosine tetraphosphate (Ap4A) HIT family hydrolase
MSFDHTDHIEGCDFCIELSGGTSDFFSTSSNSGARARIIATFSELALFPCLGEILKGHLLLAPEYHTTSMLNLKAEHGSLLRNTLEKIETVYERHHGERPLFFEHGDPTAGREFSGQCVLHAHLHVLPQWVELAEEVGRVREHLGRIKLEARSELSFPYFLVSGRDGWFDIFDATHAPRQYLRTCYSRLVGVPERAIWYEALNFEETIDSAERYRALFNDAADE